MLSGNEVHPASLVRSFLNVLYNAVLEEYGFLTRGLVDEDLQSLWFGLKKSTIRDPEPEDPDYF